MTENPKKRRRLQISDIYAYDPKVSDGSSTSGDAKDQKPALLDKLKKSYEVIKLLEHKLNSSDKENERLLQDAEKERNQFKEEKKALSEETDEAKGRSITLYTQVTESKEVLKKIKNKHLAENDEMQRKLTRLTEEKTHLEQCLAEMEQTQTLYTLSDSSNKRKHQNMIETFQHEIESFKNQIKSLNSLTQQQADTIQHQNQQISEFFNSNPSEESGNDVDDLRQLNKTLVEKLLSLERTNKRLDKDLRYYKSNFENNEILKTEKQSLALKVDKLSQIEKEYNSLKIKHTKMEANVNAWYCYISDLDQTPQNYIVNITKELEEARYLKAELNQYKKQISKRDGLVGKLETHIEELKKDIVKKQQVIASHERSSSEFKENYNMLTHHIEVLQRQLRFYDTEEQEYMNDTYDAIKSLRITELETLLKENETKLSESAVKLAELQKNTVKPLESLLPSDKTLSLLVSQLTQEIENNEEQMRTLYAQDTMLKQELDSTKAQLQKLVEAVGQTTELKDKVHISYTPLPEEASNAGESKKMRILEFKENPASVELSRRLSKLKELEKVVEKYVQNDLNNSEMVPKATLEYKVNQVGALQEKVSVLEKRIVRLNEGFKHRADEIRHLIKCVLGYDVILKSDGLVRVESVFVDGRDLAFLVKSESNDNGKLRIVGDRKDDYFRLFEDQFEAHIIHRQSIPAFLGSIVTDLQSTENDVGMEEEEGQVSDQEYHEGDYQQSDEYYMDDAPMTIQPDYPQVADEDDEEDIELDYQEEEEEEEEEEGVEQEGQYAYNPETDSSSVTTSQLAYLLAMRNNLNTMMDYDNADNNMMVTNTYADNTLQDYESEGEEDLLDDGDEEEGGERKLPADNNVITLIDSSDEEEEQEGSEEIQEFDEGEEEEEEEEEMPEYEEDEETIVEDEAPSQYRQPIQNHSHATEYEDIIEEELNDEDEEEIIESQSSQGEKEVILDDNEEEGEEEALVLEDQPQELPEGDDSNEQEMTINDDNDLVALDEEDVQNNDAMDTEEVFIQDEGMMEDITREVASEIDEGQEEMVQDEVPQEEKASVESEGHEEMIQDEVLEEEAPIETEGQEEMIEDELLQEETPIESETHEAMIEDDVFQEGETLVEAEGQEEMVEDDVPQVETPVEIKDKSTQDDHTQEEVPIENAQDETTEEPIQKVTPDKNAEEEPIQDVLNEYGDELLEDDEAILEEEALDKNLNQDKFIQEGEMVDDANEGYVMIEEGDALDEQALLGDVDVSEEQVTTQDAEFSGDSVISEEQTTNNDVDTSNEQINEEPSISIGVGAPAETEEDSLAKDDTTSTAEIDLSTELTETESTEPEQK